MYIYIFLVIATTLAVSVLLRPKRTPASETTCGHQDPQSETERKRQWYILSRTSQKPAGNCQNNEWYDLVSLSLTSSSIPRPLPESPTATGRTGHLYIQTHSKH
ncbi:hypothetical protein L209DRAFT_532037 [Thermothelomyces heterothallicus CBS 203.75]